MDSWGGADSSHPHIQEETVRVQMEYRRVFSALERHQNHLGNLLHRKHPKPLFPGDKSGGRKQTQESAKPLVTTESLPPTWRAGESPTGNPKYSVLLIHAGPLIHGFTFHGFKSMQSAVVQKHEMENSRNKQFLSFKLQAVLSSAVKSPALPRHPTWDKNPSVSTRQVLPTC